MHSIRFWLSTSQSIQSEQAQSAKNAVGGAVRGKKEWFNVDRVGTTKYYSHISVIFNF